MTRKYQYTSARAVALKSLGLVPVDATPWIDHAKFIKPGMRVVLALRVSTRERKGNLKDHERWARKRLAKLGVEVVAVVEYIGSGFDPSWLARAAAIAEQHDAVIVGTMTDRLVRHDAFDSKRNPDAQASEVDLRHAAYFAAGVPLLTLLHPNARPAQVRRLRAKIGQWAKGNKGGRPRVRQPGEKKQRRLELFDRVKALHADGYSLRDIECATRVPFRTVYDWVRQTR